MNTTIYYFSGTGNSLAVTRTLAKLLEGETTILPLALHKDNVEIDSEVLGLVFPVYFLDVPDIVKAFIEKLEFKKKTYVFTVVTSNGVPGRSLFSVSRMMRAKQQELSLGFNVDMPGNALETPSHIAEERLKSYKSKLSQAAQAVNSRETNSLQGDDSLICHVKSGAMGIAAKKILLSYKNFAASDACTGCGLCEKVCSVKNIKMVNKKPAWGNKCTTCLGCFHWCPKQAVKVGNAFNRSRYHHPEIEVGEIQVNHN